MIGLLVQHESQQHLLVPALKIFGEKLSLCLLLTIINTSSDVVVLPKNIHLGEIKLLSNTDDSHKLLVVNEVTDTINSDADAQCMQFEHSSYNQCRTTSDPTPVPKTSILIHSTIQIHRQEPLSGTKILKETKIELYKMLQKYDSIISKSDDIGQTDFILMHIATKPDAAPISA